MAYTPNVPQSNQQFPATQGPIEANFQFINSAMLVDHAWPTNEIASQADGSHQKVSLPNQGTDIASLGTGIASVLYCIGGVLYAYDGTAKRPVSAISGSGTFSITTGTTTILSSLPNDCFGIIALGAVPGVGSTCTFFVIGGVGLPSFSNSGGGGGGAIISWGFSGTNLTAVGSSAVGARPFKYIYWPV